jgi:hypothetical protein
MLFDEKFMEESNLVNIQNNPNTTDQTTKNHFDFVNDMLKPSKFR